MADSTDRYTDLQYLGLLAPVLIALIAGLVIHSFIIGVNVTDWWKGRSVTPADHIITSLVVSRMGGQCANTLYFFIHPFFWKNLDSRVTFFIGISYNFFLYANIWLTSLLSIVFCLKISNFHSRLFLYLKGMIVHRTVYLIGATLLLSGVNSLTTFLLAITKVPNGETYNITMTNLMAYCTNIDYLYPVIIGALFPLLSYFISSVLLFSSLYHHTTKMKKSRNLSINLETYYSVMKFVSFSSIYNTIYFICYYSYIFNYYVHCVNFLHIRIVLGILPVLHSSYLIYRTAKLRSQMFKLLQNLTYFLFQRKATENSENIEVVAL